MINGARYTQLIYVVAKLGIADLIKDGPKNSEELANDVGVHPRNLYRVLRALASLGIFAETTDGKFQLTPKAEPLQSNVPGSVRALATIMGEKWLWRPWGELLHTVKNGQPSFDRIFGMDFWEYLASDREAGETFNQGMTDRSATELTLVLAAYDFSDRSKIVDVGGGQGALINGILKAYPQMHGVLFDLPHVVKEARAVAEAEGIADRCEIVGGSFFEGVPTGADTYILQAVIHDWDDNHSLTILQNCRKAIASNGKLLIVDCVILPGNDPFQGKIGDINMMVTLGAQERTEAEFQLLLTAAGFKISRLIPTPSRSIIEALPV